MKKINISFKDFLNLKGLRNFHISRASKEPKKYRFLPNDIAARRHPTVQYAIVNNIEDITSDVKRITFVPDKERGTESFSKFESGQYVSIKYQIGNVITTRPYSICSSMKDIEKGILQVAIKKCDKGLTSSFVHESLKIGDKMEISSPEGQFYHEPLRDKDHVVALAGGSGITPFLSMAKSIKEGSLDFRLTIIYGSRTLEDIAFKDELDSISKECDNVNIIHVLSESDEDGYEHGFITSEIIKKHSQFASSYFICGPKAMHSPMRNALKELGIKERLIRFEVFGEAISINEFSDRPPEIPGKVNITVRVEDEAFTIEADTTKTVMRNLEESGIPVLSRCRSGVCGFCHSSLIEGHVFMPKAMDHLREADKIYNQIHLCSVFPISDITIQIAKVGRNLKI